MLRLVHVNGRNAGWGPGREAGQGRNASLQWICSLGVMVLGQPPHTGHTAHRLCVVCKDNCVLCQTTSLLAVGPPDVLLPTTATILHLTNGARMSGQIKGKPLDICHFWSETSAREGRVGVMGWFTRCSCFTSMILEIRGEMEFFTARGTNIRDTKQVFLLLVASNVIVLYSAEWSLSNQPGQFMSNWHNQQL